MLVEVGGTLVIAAEAGYVGKGERTWTIERASEISAKLARLSSLSVSPPKALPGTGQCWPAAKELSQRPAWLPRVSHAVRAWRAAAFGPVVVAALGVSTNTRAVGSPGHVDHAAVGLGMFASRPLAIGRPVRDVPGFAAPTPTRATGERFRRMRRRDRAEQVEGFFGPLGALAGLAVVGPKLARGYQGSCS